jgi:hypothetical protein
MEISDTFQSAIQECENVNTKTGLIVIRKFYLFQTSIAGCYCYITSSSISNVNHLLCVKFSENLLDKVSKNRKLSSNVLKLLTCQVPKLEVVIRKVLNLFPPRTDFIDAYMILCKYVVSI